MACGKGRHMTERKCANCMWWWNADEFGLRGDCRAIPPQWPDRHGGVVWPRTYSDDWCGAFRMKEPSE
jgi:hypothetical protein